MRPKISVKIKGIKDKLRTYLINFIRENGPIFENELKKEALKFFNPDLKRLSDDLIKTYSLYYSRKIGKNTAEYSVIKSFEKLLAEIKEEIPHTKKQIILGRKRFGRLFYLEGQEGKLQEKILEIVNKTPSKARDVLKEIEEKGFIYLNPSNKKAAELLEYFGIVDIKAKNGKYIAIKKGFSEEIKEESINIKGTIKPFIVSVLVINKGIKKKKLKFDFAGYDINKDIFFLGIERDYVSLNDVKNFYMKYLLLRLPAKLICICKEISKKAEEFCNNWGIEVRRR